jgi:hypothetical protein
LSIYGFKYIKFFGSVAQVIRVPALQAQSPEVKPQSKPQSHQKKKKKKEKTFFFTFLSMVK